MGRVGLPGRGAGGRRSPSEEQRGSHGHWTGPAAALGTRGTPRRGEEGWSKLGAIQPNSSNITRLAEPSTDRWGGGQGGSGDGTVNTEAPAGRGPRGQRLHGWKSPGVITMLLSPAVVPRDAWFSQEEAEAEGEGGTSLERHSSKVRRVLHPWGLLAPGSQPSRQMSAAVSHTTTLITPQETQGRFPN